MKPAHGTGKAAHEARAEEEARWSAWMRRANRGDAVAYERLLTEIGDVMERYLRRHLGDPELVEECVQECLLSIHRARATYDPRRSFRAWMFAIVRHKAIDLLRRRGTRTRHEAAAPSPEAVSVPAVDPSAAPQAAEALAAIRPEHREALILTKLLGHSLADAARMAGVSVTAMKSRVHRGIREVRRLLERGDD